MRKSERPVPTCWPEFFAALREDYIPIMGLPPFELTGHYLEKLERVIRERWQGPDIPAIEAMPFGVLFGDVLVRKFKCHWRYSKWTPKVLDGNDILDHTVELVGDDDGRFACKPVLTVVKFVDNPDHTLTSVYDCFEAVANGELSFSMMQWLRLPGHKVAVVDLNPETTMKFYFDDEKEDDE